MALPYIASTLLSCLRFAGEASGGDCSMSANAWLWPMATAKFRGRSTRPPRALSSTTPRWEAGWFLRVRAAHFLWVLLFLYYVTLQGAELVCAALVNYTMLAF